MADEPDAFRKGLSIAMRIGVELVAALIVGGGLGYVADSYFNSSPVGILIGVFLGMSAGLLNRDRTAARLCTDESNSRHPFELHPYVSPPLFWPGISLNKSVITMLSLMSLA